METSVGGITPTGLRKVAAENAAKAFAMGEGAEHLGTHHRTWQYVFAGFALLLAIASGAGGLLDIAVLAGIAGVIASALAGFQAKSDLSSGVLARFHFTQSAGYADLGRRYQALAEGPDEPTSDQLNALSEEWRRLQSRPVQGAQAAKD
jgi:hypothetical protein